MIFEELPEFRKDLKSLKVRGVNSGLRLIYTFFENEKKIVFIEFYHKNDKSCEDKNRILANFK